MGPRAPRRSACMGWRPVHLQLDVAQPEDHEHNNGWRWSVAWSVAMVFFLIHYGSLGRKSFPEG